MTRRTAGMMALVLLLAGCDDMTDQDKAKAYSRAAGSVHEAQDSVPAHEAAASAPPLTLALLERGQQRYRIYCTPCHSELGDGNGMVVQRGFPHPPSYHIERLRQESTQHFYDVITHGYGAMYSFAGRVAPDVRWAIAAYIRALQLSQHASAADIASARP
jgi:mono/diheme cytochrome c family protein